MLSISIGANFLDYENRKNFDRNDLRGAGVFCKCAKRRKSK